MNTSGAIGLGFGLLIGSLSALVIAVALLHFFTSSQANRKVSDFSRELLALPALWGGGTGADWFTGSVLKAVPDQASLLLWYVIGLVMTLIPVLFVTVVLVLLAAIDLIRKLR